MRGRVPTGGLPAIIRGIVGVGRSAQNQRGPLTRRSFLKSRSIHYAVRSYIATDVLLGRAMFPIRQLRRNGQRLSSPWHIRHHTDNLRKKDRVWYLAPGLKWKGTRRRYRRSRRSQWIRAMYKQRIVTGLKGSRTNRRRSSFENVTLWNLICMCGFIVHRPRKTRRTRFRPERTRESIPCFGTEPTSPPTPPSARCIRIPTWTSFRLQHSPVAQKHHYTPFFMGQTLSHLFETFVTVFTSPESQAIATFAGIFTFVIGVIYLLAGTPWMGRLARRIWQGCVSLNSCRIPSFTSLWSSLIQAYHLVCDLTVIMCLCNSSVLPDRRARPAHYA